jgi:antitoxin VapB
MNRTRTLALALAIIALATSCQTEQPEDDGAWTDPPSHVNSPEEIEQEIAEKMDRLAAYMDEKGFDAALLTQVRNVNWITAGVANTQIVLNKDVGAATLMIMNNETRDRYVIANGSEMPRLMNESLADLGYEAIEYPWYEANAVKDVRGAIVHRLVGSGKVGSDVPYPGAVELPEDFKTLRYQLTDSELARYRWVGEKTTEAVEEVCRTIEPGMNEYEIEARTASAIRARGIFPTVLLTAVDDRISQYRHALPGGETLARYAMINVVAEKWGMPVAVTRFVHFGPVPEELQEKLDKTAIVNARFTAATKPGVSGAEIFEACKEWYAEVGYEDEWKNHHQGGAIGYDDREWVIYPGVEKTVHARQAFAWNPTITGAKVENTIVVFEDGYETITETGDWPLVVINLDGELYPQPNILVRDPKTFEPVEQEEYELIP